MIAKINQFRTRALYPALYPWLIALAALDVMVTWVVLALGGQEFNVVARIAIDAGGLAGMAVLKLVMMSIVLGICEFVGRREHRLGRRLAEGALAANTLAVSLGCAFLSQYWIESMML